MQEELATWAESWGVISQFINSKKHMSRLDGQCLPRINLETRRIAATIADIISSRTRRGYEAAQQKLGDTNRIPFLMDNYVFLPARDNHSGTHPEAGTQLEVLLARVNPQMLAAQIACSSKRHQVNITPYMQQNFHPGSKPSSWCRAAEGGPPQAWVLKSGLIQCVRSGPCA